MHNTLSLVHSVFKSSRQLANLSELYFDQNNFQPLKVCCRDTQLPIGENSVYSLNLRYSTLLIMLINSA